MLGSGFMPALSFFLVVFRARDYLAEMTRVILTIAVVMSPILLLVLAQGLIRMEETGGMAWMFFGVVGSFSGILCIASLFDSLQGPR